jgi:carbamate kinase
VDVDIFLIATDVQGVALNYGKKNQEFLRTLTTRQAARFVAQGHFPLGSMGPKIEAAVQFVRKTGKRAVIASIEDIENAVKGESGTEIIR